MQFAQLSLQTPTYGPDPSKTANFLPANSSNTVSQVIKVTNNAHGQVLVVLYSL